MQFIFQIITNYSFYQDIYTKGRLVGFSALAGFKTGLLTHLMHWHICTKYVFCTFWGFVQCVPQIEFIGVIFINLIQLFP